MRLDKIARIEPRFHVLPPGIALDLELGVDHGLLGCGLGDLIWWRYHDAIK